MIKIDEYIKIMSNIYKFPEDVAYNIFLNWYNDTISKIELDGMYSYDDYIKFIHTNYLPILYEMPVSEYHLFRCYIKKKFIDKYSSGQINSISMKNASKKSDSIYGNDIILLSFFDWLDNSAWWKNFNNEYNMYVNALNLSLL